MPAARSRGRPLWVVMLNALDHQTHEAIEGADRYAGQRWSETVLCTAKLCVRPSRFMHKSRRTRGLLDGMKRLLACNCWNREYTVQHADDFDHADSSHAISFPSRRSSQRAVTVRRTPARPQYDRLSSFPLACAVCSDERGK